MFGSKKRGLRRAETETGPVARSYIAAGMSVTGDMEGDIDLQLDGRLEGNLRCRSVTVGKSGEVIGRVVAQEVIVDGRIEGDVEAKAVRLNVTALMIGDVRHDVIEVAAGARIEGRYSRISGKGSAGHAVRSSHKMDASEPPQKAPAGGASLRRPHGTVLKEAKGAAAHKTG